MGMTVFIIITVIVLAIMLAATVAYLKNRGLEGIRNDVYVLFVRAEHKYKESGSGKQKMKWVIGMARALLPSWLQAIISEELLSSVVQKWFDAVKDLLDDGKLNCSVVWEEDAE